MSRKRKTIPDNSYIDGDVLMHTMVDVEVEYDANFHLLEPNMNIQGVGQDPSSSRQHYASSLPDVYLESDILPTVPPCSHKRKTIHDNSYNDANVPMHTLFDVQVEHDANFRLPESNMNIEVGQNLCSSRQRIASSLPDVYLEPDILPTIPPCSHCNAKRFKNETKGFCCSNNGVKLVLYDSPSELYDLFTSRSDESAHFRTYVRTYNNTLAFTSLGVTCDLNLCRRNRGVYTFKAQGQIYHSIKSLLPLGVKPSNLQLYFYDTDHEMQNRLALSDRLQEGTLKDILRLLANNPYSKFFRNLGSIPDLVERAIVIRSNVPLDQRVYNAPTASQVGGMWIEGDNCSSSEGRDIIVQGKLDKTYKVHYYYGCYDPMQYVLLFPLGESGWHPGISRNNMPNRTNISIRPRANIENFHSAEQLLNEEERVMQEGKQCREFISCREYYSYKLQIRHNHKSVLLHSGRLFQQYCVDMYIKLESSRLDFMNNNQKKLRAELYTGLADCITAGERQACKIGSRIVLPASFIGGPRDMRRRYVDAMTLVQHFGKPDLFITMTCNPSWIEIKRELLPNEEAQNRPDLIARVFRSKLEELKHDLFKKQIFGEVAAYVYVVEFQKRGLPHVHFLLIMKDSAKIRSPDQYDQFVSAEIPDQKLNANLHRAVWRHMMHGPCGEMNPTNVCMKQNGTCKNKYPKNYCERTTQGQDSFPIYMRRKKCEPINVRNHLLDNQWVIPYNPFLLAKYDCHMNVEICSTIKAVKYLYKYIYKGHDRVSFQIAADGEHQLQINEISNFQNARWISPPEAMWRIYSFALSEMHPPVINLHLHLKNQHSVVYSESADLEGVLRDPRSSMTMLTEYFNLNKTNSVAQNLLYKDLPTKFVWVRGKKEWHPRKNKSSCIGRVVTVHPMEGDRYYLRLKLNNTKGATSFDHLKTVDGKIASTFKEACQWSGLLEDDNSLELCLREASSFEMPQSLRCLFSTLLVYCNPANARNLWEQFGEFMAEDYLHQVRMTQDSAKLMALKDIAERLESMGKNINDFHLIDREIDFSDVEREARELNDELNIEIPIADLASVSLLNEKQRYAYETILNKVWKSEPGAFFIDGPGGTGKTFLYCALLAVVRSKGYVALATASSGVAAGILPGGRTAHSRFRIPVKNEHVNSCVVSKQSGLGKLLRTARLIIWDEAPMIKRSCIEAVNLMLQDICDSDALFGGKIVVFGGDFRQVLPVVRKGDIAQTIEASLVKSPLWPLLEKIHLTENMRAQHDSLFADFLLELGNGQIPALYSDNIKLPPSMLLPYNGEASLHNLINLTFPNLDVYSQSFDAMVNLAILTPKNEYVDQINDIIIDQIPGVFNEYRSFDHPIDNANRGLTDDFFNALTPSGFPPHLLRLKKHCPVMLLRNIDPSKGLCNGTRLICKSFMRNNISAIIASGAHKGEHVFLPRIPLTLPENEGNPFIFQRTQFPIRLSFAMTVNKAQGQTLDFVGIYLPQPVFSHGQLYVALSRAKKLSSVAVLIVPEKGCPPTEVTTRNVVYDEVLRLAKTY